MFKKYTIGALLLMCALQVSANTTTKNLDEINCGAPPKGVVVTKSHWSWFGLWGYKTVDPLMIETTLVKLDCAGSGQQICHWPQTINTNINDGLTTDEVTTINNAVLNGVEQQHANDTTLTNGVFNYTTSTNGQIKYFNCIWDVDATGSINHNITITYN